MFGVEVRLRWRPMTHVAPLDRLEPGQPIVFGGNRISYVDERLAREFSPGDRLVVVHDTGALLRIPAADHALVTAAVDEAAAAFGALAQCTDAQITEFYKAFAARLADDGSFAPIAAANEADVASAAAAGRSTTRLVLSRSMRAGMIDGLEVWRSSPGRRDEVVDTVRHHGWSVQSRRAPLGVVGFVFEGRPNVFADATGVLRSGNTVVFRIGSDALATARAIMAHAVRPALSEAGLPRGAVCLLDTPSRAAGLALFSQPRLALAVARGSGAAVGQLGAVARQSGVPVSLHGTGGAWVVAASSADAGDFAAAVQHSLDRKVCNTLNVCCIVRQRAGELVPRFLDALAAAAAARQTVGKVHATPSAMPHIPAEWRQRTVRVQRADGPHDEPQVEPIDIARLGHEWEWERSPEVSLAVVDSVDDAVRLFNEHSPLFTASLMTADESEFERFYATIDAPFVGNGFTRWVDGQFALQRPELGLANWQNGRLLARGGVLSGDSVYTLRLRASVHDHGMHR